MYRISSTRYLGLTFDKNMKWELHVINIVMCTRTLSFSFYKLKAYLSVQTMSVMYMLVFLPIFQYGLLVGRSLSEITVRLLQIL